MHNFAPRAGMGMVGIGLLGLIACQMSQQREAPDLPAGTKADVSPRLNASTYVAHGHLLEQQGNLEQAAAQYRRALQLTPELTAARNRLGITLNKLGRHAEASAEFRAAIATSPGAAHLYNNLGFSLYLEGRYAEAAQALARAVELQPTFRRAHMNRGLVLGRMGRFEEALGAFRLAGSEADAYFNLALVQADAGRYADAAHALEQALRVNPDFAAAREQLREISRLAAAAEQMGAERDAGSQAVPQAGVLVSQTEGLGTQADQATFPSPVGDQESGLGDQGSGIGDPVPEAPLPGPGDAPDISRVFAEIEAWLAAAAEALPPPPPWEGISAAQLTAMFDELVGAMLTNAPWYQGSLCRLRELLGLPENGYGSEFLVPNGHGQP